ncbi:hypothetical protein PanWU01x14_210070 [Parasponia andersonii]|uniref:Uncharacterized protein n=1 Tax=Parasponia andersonii TaxID=3476 RepID=A0A2P5BU36_PARAD|nr:hypothetical protein PanWU01x14_210070 [Parasponia andersonii]
MEIYAAMWIPITMVERHEIQLERSNSTEYLRYCGRVTTDDRLLELMKEIQKENYYNSGVQLQQDNCNKIGWLSRTFGRRENSLDEIKKNIHDFKKNLDEEMISQYNEADLAREFGTDSRGLVFTWGSNPFSSPSAVGEVSHSDQLRADIAKFLLITNVMAPVDGLREHVTAGLRYCNSRRVYSSPSPFRPSQLVNHILGSFIRDNNDKIK